MLRAVVAGATLTALAGCGHSAQSAAARNQKLFSTAPPELKTTWDRASKAVAANDYAGAMTNLRILASAPGLTPEQGRAVQETATAVSDQMYAAANNGDTNARKALDELRKLSGR